MMLLFCPSPLLPLLPLSCKSLSLSSNYVSGQLTQLSSASPYHFLPCPNTPENSFFKLCSHIFWLLKGQTVHSFKYFLTLSISHPKKGGGRRERNMKLKYLSKYPNIHKVQRRLWEEIQIRILKKSAKKLVNGKERNSFLQFSGEK